MPEEMLVQIARRLREHRHWRGDRPVRLLVGGVVITSDRDAVDRRS